MILSSPAVKDGILDKIYGIDTPDKSTVDSGIPQLSFRMDWDEVPDGTKSFAVIYIDYDNQEDEGVPWVHWLGLIPDSSRRSLPEDAARTDKGLIHGKNSWSLPYGPYLEVPERLKTGYGGPAPGRCHEYELTLYALDNVPDLKTGFYINDLRRAMRGHVLAETTLRMNYGG